VPITSQNFNFYETIRTNGFKVPMFTIYIVLYNNTSTCYDTIVQKEQKQPQKEIQYCKNNDLTSVIRR
jgi:hypothetical protein